MAKDPAFLFYYDRFLAGTISMTNEEVGQYIRLLCIQANKGHISQKDMLNICATHDNDVCLKFAPRGEGKFVNLVLEEICLQRKSYTESRRNNRKGKKSTLETDMNHICESHDEHMVNVNVNVNKDINTEEGVQGETNNHTPVFESSTHQQFSDNWFADIFNELEMENIRSVFREHDLTNELMIFKLKVRGSKSEYINRDFGGIRSAFIYQLKTSNAKKHDRRHGKETIRRADAVIEAPTSWGQF